MTNKTIEVYRDAILELYKKNDGGQLSGYLANPTPAQVKEACLFVCNNNRGRIDQEIIARFFKIEGNKDGIKVIEGFNNGKLKSTSDFLKGKSKSNSAPRLDLVALLIDFNPRPYAKFQKNTESDTVAESEEGKLVGTVIDKEDGKLYNEEESVGIVTESEEGKLYNEEESVGVVTESEEGKLYSEEESMGVVTESEEGKLYSEEESVGIVTESEEGKLYNEEESVDTLTDSNEGKQNYPEQPKGTKNIAKEGKESLEQNGISNTNIKTNVSIYVISALLISSLGGYIILRPVKKECMIWKDDRYIKITCDLHNESNLDLWKLENFRGVDVDKDTEFFDKNANPKIWYDKTGKEITFYNNPGIHPTNGKTLRPITETIIRKYVLPQE